jgi:integrase
MYPCKGVKAPTVPVNEYRILTPDEIARLLLALPNDPARLLVETAIGSGLRWGELIEIRAHDFHPASGILTVTRAVVELHPDDRGACLFWGENGVGG